MSNSESESGEVPESILTAAKEIQLSSLPDISRQRYTAVYNNFKKWRKTKKNFFICRRVDNSVF